MAKSQKTKPSTETQSGTDAIFKQGEKTYVVVIPSLIIPGIGKLTASDVCADEKAQKYLVDNKSEAIRELAV